MVAKPKSAEAASRRKQYSAPALEKGLDILELLARETEGLSLSEIARHLDRSVGELFRMLVVLEQRNYVALQPGTDMYMLTLKMFELSHRFPPVKRLTSVASSVMKQLAYDIEQSCHLVIYYEGKGHVVVQQDSPSERMFSVRLGAEAPLVNTCSGHLLLAYSDDKELERMLQKIPSYHEKLNKKQIEGVIERVKGQGYEIVRSAQAQGVQDIGYPVFDYSGHIVAALVVPFLSYLDGSHAVGIEKAQERVHRVACEVSEALGYKSR